MPAFYPVSKLFFLVVSIGGITVMDGIVGELVAAGKDLIKPLGRGAIFRVAASVAALCTVGSLLGQGRSPLSGATDGRLEALDGGPLGVALRASTALKIPSGGIEPVGAYLGGDAGVHWVGPFAAVLAVVLTFKITPIENEIVMAVPSVQASTWWVCAAIVRQALGPDCLWNLLGWLAIWWVGCAILGRVRRRRTPWRAALDFCHLLAALVYVGAVVLPVIFDRGGWDGRQTKRGGAID